MLIPLLLGVSDRGPLSSKARETIREHWVPVNERSGQPFDQSVLDRTNLVYDTKPSCRLLLTLRQAYPQLAVPFLTRLGERFFKEGADLTNEHTLVEIGRNFGLAPETVLTALRSPDFAEVLKTEWQETHKLGVSGYPTLLALGDGKAEVITIGFERTEAVIKKIQALL